MGSEIRAIVDVELMRKSTLAESFIQSVGEAIDVFPEIEFSVRDQTRVVVYKDKPEGLPLPALNNDCGTVKAIGLPYVIRQFSLKAPHILRCHWRRLETMPLENPVNTL